ncbi:unnamed protein product, partial [Hymenolepis diminuta]
MNDHMPGINYAGGSSVLSDDDLASDIEADLQELPIEGEDFESTDFGLRSASLFTESFTSLLSSDISDDSSFSHSSTPKSSFQ